MIVLRRTCESVLPAHLHLAQKPFLLQLMSVAHSSSVDGARLLHVALHKVLDLVLGVVIQPRRILGSVFGRLLLHDDVGDL